MIQLFAFELLDEKSFVSMRPFLLEKVSSSCANKVLEFKHYDDAQRHLTGDLLARYALWKLTGSWSKDTFVLGDKGKPSPEGINGIYYNISHSGKWVVVIADDNNVGIDVEKIRKFPAGVAERFFSETEKSLINNTSTETEKQELFFTIWTLKESFLKAIGKGLTKSLSSFTVEKDHEGNWHLGDDTETSGMYVKSIPFVEGYKLSVCTSNPFVLDKIDFVTIKDFTNL